MEQDKKMQTRRSPLGGIIMMVLVSALLAACAGPAVQAKREIYWPPPPLPPQVAWVSEIGDYHDAGISRGFWRRVADFFVGEKDQHIGRSYGIYVDEHERLFIVDTVYGVVHVMDGRENTYEVIGQKEGAPVFKNPIAITGDEAGNVYITDSVGGVVYRHNLKEGILTSFIQSLERPTGIAFNRNNRLLYVSDTVNDQVAVYDLKGNERFRIGRPGTAPGQFNHPTDLFIDRQGTLYVTDPLNARIQIFSPEGRYQRTFGRPGDSGGDFSKPKGVAVDSAGYIYVVDALLDVVQVYDPSGRFWLDFGETGSGAGQFWLPSGMYIDARDRIYVSDTYNRRVQVFRRILPEAAEKKER
jgi:DNA-binding beta-propeller fold protein YncE